MCVCAHELQQAGVVIWQQPAPELAKEYGPLLCDFVAKCLIKDAHSRPRYSQPSANEKTPMLTQHPFYVKFRADMDSSKMLDWFTKLKVGVTGTAVGGGAAP